MESDPNPISNPNFPIVVKYEQIKDLDKLGKKTQANKKSPLRVDLKEFKFE